MIKKVSQSTEEPAQVDQATVTEGGRFEGRVEKKEENREIPKKKKKKKENYFTEREEEKLRRKRERELRRSQSAYEIRNPPQKVSKTAEANKGRTGEEEAKMV